MKSSSALTAAKTVIRWLRWTAVLALVYSAWGGLLYSVLGRKAWALQPAPLAVVLQQVGMLHFHGLPEMGFVVAGAMIAPRARLATAIVLAAVNVPLSLWNHGLSRVSLDELVLLQVNENFAQFTLDTLGSVLGVVFIFWSEKAKRCMTSVPPSRSSFMEPPSVSAGARAAFTAPKTVIRWLRWAAVLTLVYSAWGALVYSALGREAWALVPAPIAVVQELVFMLHSHALGETGFVVAGAMFAPRARLAMAIVLAAALVPLSLWNHVLGVGGPWWFWTISYTHFTFEAFGAVLGVVFVFWSEKVKLTLTSIPPDPPSP
jgi:hypothetical protein